MNNYNDVAIGTSWDNIDEGIRNVIYLLNKKGYKTWGCCEGHWSDASNCYCQAYIAFYNDYVPEVPRLKEFKVRLHKLIEPKELFETYNMDNYFIFDVSNNSDKVFFWFDIQNIGKSKEEQVELHQNLLEELLEWVSNLKERDEELCLRRKEWFSRFNGAIDNSKLQDIYDCLCVPENKDINLDREWNDKWANIFDNSSLDYYSNLEKGCLCNGYSLKYVVLYSDGRNVFFDFYNPAEAISFAKKLEEAEAEMIEEASFMIAYNGKFVSLNDIGICDIEEDSILDYLYLYKFLAYENTLVKSPYNGLYIDFKFEIKNSTESVFSKECRWWFCESDMDCSFWNEEEQRFDFGPFYDIKETRDIINDFIKSNWTQDSLELNCHVKLEDSEQYVMFPISNGSYRIIEGEDFKNIMLTGFRLMNN